MAGATARPVTRDEILRAKKTLEQSVKRMEEALQIMLNASLDTIQVRAHIAMTKGVKAVSGMSSDIKARAEDAQLSAELGTPTKLQASRDHRSAYGKRVAPKKKSNRQSKRTESP